MAKDEYHFERLTPINDIELKVYEDAINYVFENQAIKNVAISGAPLTLTMFSGTAFCPQRHLS